MALVQRSASEEVLEICYKSRRGTMDQDEPAAERIEDISASHAQRPTRSLPGPAASVCHWL